MPTGAQTQVVSAVISAAVILIAGPSFGQAGEKVTNDPYPSPSQTYMKALPDPPPDFSEMPFATFPATVDDELAILESHKLDDPEGRKRNIRIADGDPPEGADRNALARFFLERGRGAREIGRLGQAMDDLTKAKKFGGKLSARIRWKLLSDLAAVNTEIGHHDIGIRHLRESLGLVEAFWHSERRKISVHARLARSLARAGRFEEARLHLAKATGRLDRPALRTKLGALGRGNKDWELVNKLPAVLAWSKGEIMRFEGRYGEAEAAYRISVQHYSEQDDRRGLGTARWGLAAVLSAQGRFREAEIEARRALVLSLGIYGRDHYRTAAGLKRLARIVGAQGRVKVAEKLYRAAIDILKRTNVAPETQLFIRTRAAYARNLVHQSRWHGALAEFAAIRATEKRNSRSVDRNPDFALALIKSGRLTEGLVVAKRAIAWAEQRYGPKHIHTATARGIAAMALSGLGLVREALRDYATSNRVMLSHVSSLFSRQHTQLSDWRIRTVLESFLSLLKTKKNWSSGTVGGSKVLVQGFRIADALRKQGIQNALHISHLRAASKDQQLGKLIARKKEVTDKLQAVLAQYSKALDDPLEKVPSDPWERDEWTFSTEEPDRTVWYKHGLMGSQPIEPWDQDRDALDELESMIAALRQEQKRVDSEILNRFPAYAKLVRLKLPTVSEVQVRLHEKQALIATYSTATSTYVWAVPKGGKMAFAAVPLGKGKIAAMVKRLRKGLEYHGDTLAGIPVFDVDLAHELYKHLLKPVSAGWKGAEDLLVVAQGPLAQLPFSLLVTEKSAVRDENLPLFSGYKEVPWLARRHGVTSLPTVSSLLVPRPVHRTESSRRNFAAFADPVFDRRQKPQSGLQTLLASAAGVPKEAGILLRAVPRLVGKAKARLDDLPRLPQTATEVAAIGRWLGAESARDIFTGARAQEERVKSMDLTPYRVVAFATHALMPHELEGLTQPALAMTAPEVSGGGGDGLLTEEEILNLKLDADWVVLSGCNTGHRSGLQAEALSGLARAFLHAGARSLLITQSEVESTAARLLVTDLFRRQVEDPGLSRSQAMRQAKLALIDGAGYQDIDGETLFAYAHPIFWAPFALFGEGAPAPTREVLKPALRKAAFQDRAENPT